MNSQKEPERPIWLRKKVVLSEETAFTRRALSDNAVSTVCKSSACPNSTECFSRKFATFLILGDRCTRSCGFCAVKGGAPLAVDELEPARIRSATLALGLRHAVLTSPARDDLEDGGAAHFAATVRAIRCSPASITVEVLVPDFLGRIESVRQVMESGPDIFSHNIETASRLYPNVRPGADYGRSLEILAAAKWMSSDTVLKSGFMLGLGESRDDIVSTMEDLRAAGCDILTIGQYLKPRPDKMQISRFVKPEEFRHYAKIGREIGFRYVTAGPFVRSSYMAEEAYQMAVGEV